MGSSGRDIEIAVGDARGDQFLLMLPQCIGIFQRRHRAKAEEENLHLLVKLVWILTTMRTGSARSESLVIRTATSNLFMYASRSRWHPRFTSEPFSSVLSTQTFCAGTTSVRYIGTECVRKRPYLMCRFGIVLSARMYKPWS